LNAVTAMADIPSGLSNVVPIRPEVKVTVNLQGDVLGGVVHACKAWGRTQVWIQTNRDRYGNEDGWPQSIAGRMGQAIQAGGAFSARERDVMTGDAQAVSVACRGMPELAYCVLWMQYVLVKGRKFHRVWKQGPDKVLVPHGGKMFEVPRLVKEREYGDWHKVSVKTKANELGMGTNDYYKHLNGAHMWIAARLESVRTK
jgi:hypothetical protein